MKKLAMSFAAVALLGSLGAAPPVFAAPAQPALNCKDPAQAQDPRCTFFGGKLPGGPNNPNGAVQPGNAPDRQGGRDHAAPPDNQQDHNQVDRNRNDNRFDNGRQHDRNGPNRNGPRVDRGHPPFQAFRRSFDFPRFDRPFFDVRPGIAIPRSYRLRPVPPQILWYYPEYAGYLYFVTRSDDVVIVSPRSHRIVDIL